MRLRRVRVVGRSFAPALAHASTIATPPAPTAQYLGVGLQRPCRGQTFGRFTAELSIFYRLYLYSGKVSLPAMCLRQVRVAGGCFAVELAHVSTAVVLPERFRHKTSARASRRPFRVKRVAACLGRWRALSLRGPPRRRAVQRPHLRGNGQRERVAVLWRYSCVRFTPPPSF